MPARYSLIVLLALQSLHGMSEEAQRQVISQTAAGLHTYLTEHSGTLRSATNSLALNELDSHLEPVIKILSVTRKGPHQLLELMDLRDPNKTYSPRQLLTEREFGTITYWDPINNLKKSASTYDDPIQLPLSVATHYSPKIVIHFSQDRDERRHVLSYNLLALMAQHKLYPQILRIMNRCEYAGNPMMRPSNGLEPFNTLQNVVAGESDVSTSAATHLLLERLQAAHRDTNFRLLYAVSYPWYEKTFDALTETAVRQQLLKGVLLMATGTGTLVLFNSSEAARNALIGSGMNSTRVMLASIAAGAAGMYNLLGALYDHEHRPSLPNHPMIASNIPR